ncbi:MAG: glycoside hydrolase family 75 protein [Labedaea sp.]
MRKLLIVAATMLAAASVAPAATSASPQTSGQTSVPVSAQAGAGVLAGPSASALLAKTSSCNQISNGKFRTDEETGRTVPVCDSNGAVWWRADMDIDCDGQRTSNCNEDTDCCFQADTAFHQSDGRPLRADSLHYIVVPSPSNTWRYTSSGLRGAGSCAVIFNNRVLYTVIGDTGPTAIIGEASYATARDLGIDPDPSTGGTDGPVTYICFKNSRVSPIESNSQATSVGQGLANTFVANN